MTKEENSRITSSSVEIQWNKSPYVKPKVGVSIVVISGDMLIRHTAFSESYKKQLMHKEFYWSYEENITNIVRFVFEIEPSLKGLA